MKSSRLKQMGFSLVEIMIVLAIIGTILGMIGSRINNARQKAKVKEAKIQMDSIANGLSMYYNDCGKYPKSLDGLVKADADCPNWVDPYYKGKLQDPWNGEYQYENSGNEFVLKSFGQDGREGGAQLSRDIVYGEENAAPGDSKSRE